jgi:organic hydroperoxide reductase OsmC/OhrA
MAFLSFVKVFHRARKSRASGEVRRMIWAAMTEDIEEEHGLGGSKRHDATSSQSSTKQNPAAHHRALVAEAAAGVPEQLIVAIRLGCFIGRAA